MPSMPVETSAAQLATIGESLTYGSSKATRVGITAVDANDTSIEHVQQGTFHLLPNARFKILDDKGLNLLLQKWGFGDDMGIAKFRYEENVKTNVDLDNLIKSFFASDNAEVRGTLSHMGCAIVAPDKVVVDKAQLNVSETSMEIFQKFEDAGAIGAGGHIRGRIEEMYEGIPIVNLIREVLYMEESEIYDTYGEEERKQFLFRIFQHVNVGGACNQYEDDVENYLKATKVIYRDLVSARKKANDSGDVEVTSQIFDIKDLGRGGALFRTEHPSNFCYVIVEPLLRHLTVWRFNYKNAWGSYK